MTKIGMREEDAKISPELEGPEGQTKLPRAGGATTGGHSHSTGHRAPARGTGEGGAQRGERDIKGILYRCPKSKERMHGVAAVLLVPAMV